MESVQRWTWRILAFAVAALSIFWRFETLDRRPLWLDEQSTARVVRESPDLVALWRTGSADKYLHPPLAYLAPWSVAHGNETPFRLRLPSALAGLVSIALVGVVGMLLFERWTGLLAAFLIGISLYHVDFSQEARPYMMGLALTLAQYAALLAWLAGRRNAWLAAFAVCAVGALYTYHLALVHVGIAVGVAALSAVRANRDGAAARRRAVALAVALLAVALSYVPQLRNLAGFLASGDAVPSHVLALSPRFFHAVAQRWGSGSGSTTLLYAAAFGLGAVRVAAWRDTRALILLGWATGPLLLFAVKPFSKYFDLRFVISSLPVFFLLASAGVTAAVGVAGALVARAGLPASATRAARAVVFGGAVLAFLVPATRLYGSFRNAELRCGDFVNRFDILEANDRLCADHLVLNSIWVEHQFIVRSLRGGIALDLARLDEFAGTYEFEAGPPIQIERQDDHLIARIAERLPYELVPESETRFFYRTLSNRTIEFERGADDRVASLSLAAGGRTARAWRKP